MDSKTRIKHLSGSFYEIRIGTRIFHTKRDGMRSWTLMGTRSGRHFEDGGYTSRTLAIIAAVRQVVQEQVASEQVASEQ